MLRVLLPATLFPAKAPSSAFTIAALLATAIGITGAAPALAQSNSMMVDVGPCVRIESAIQRFACYENQVEVALTGSGENYQAAPRPSQTSPSTPAPSTTAPARVSPAVPAAAAAGAAGIAATQNSADNFGLPEPREENDEASDELFSSIAELEETVPNSYLITLANGQVWRQVRADSRFRMQVGQEVRIYPTRWGSDYRLSVEDLRGFIQVERVR